MLLGFKRRFAPHVEDGSKTHTIRSKRKVRPKVGETCHCYVDPRQKSMRLLGRFECVRVQDIEIGALPRSREIACSDGRHYKGYISIDGVRLSLDECDQFAWRDGFRPEGTTYERPGKAFAMMFAYWTEERTRNGKHDPLPFHGDVIHWRYTGR